MMIRMIRCLWILSVFMWAAVIGNLLGKPLGQAMLFLVDQGYSSDGWFLFILTMLGVVGLGLPSAWLLLMFWAIVDQWIIRSFSCRAACHES